MSNLRALNSPASSLLLLLIAIVCALGIVASQHQARKLFVGLQKEKSNAQQMEVEWGQLQLEQSTWAMPAHVEKIATITLHMQVPKQGGGQIHFVGNGPTLGKGPPR